MKVLRKDDIQLYNKNYYDNNRERILDKIKILKPRKTGFCSYCRKYIILSKKDKHEKTILHKTRYQIMNQQHIIEQMTKNMFN